MKTAFDCIPCFIRQAAESIAMAAGDDQQSEGLLRRLLHEIAETDWNVMPVSIAQRIQRLIREETGQTDPYRSLKDRMNRTALDLLPALTATLQQSRDPREAATRLAIAGNLLDAGSKTRLDIDMLEQRLDSIWDAPLDGDVMELFQAADAAHCILYLADNAGEIVFDRLLIEALPAEKITVAVRGMPVINDATLDDAEIAGIPEVAPVFGNGSDAPGTLVEECSDEFKYWFNRADMIIAKGQGNYETLADIDRNIYFLLTVKCPIIGAEVNAPVGAMIIKNRKRQNDG